MFPPDFRLQYDHQIYRPLGIVPRVGSNSVITRKIAWATNCPVCGVDFVVLTLMTASKWRRRCDRCKNPALTVRAARRTFRRQIAGEEP